MRPGLPWIILLKAQIAEFSVKAGVVFLVLLLL
jgi:hypothetical protein